MTGFKTVVANHEILVFQREEKTLTLKTMRTKLHSICCTPVTYSKKLDILGALYYNIKIILISLTF